MKKQKNKSVKPIQPGRNSSEEIFSVPDSICKATAKFVHDQLETRYMKLRCADVGERNKKIQFVENVLLQRFVPLTSLDFNEQIPVFNGAWSQYDVITCFEVIEHIQNPLLLMKNINLQLAPRGILFLSTPARPRIFYPSFHFHEMSAKHLQKWILDPYDLKIVAHKRIRIPMPWWKHFTGIRPFLRIFINYTHIYKIVHKWEE